MQKPDVLHKTAINVTRWIGSVQSIIVHTILFIASFGLSIFGVLPFDEMLLILTTIVSLEAIYLALFIQMTVNYATAAVEEVGEDIDEIQEDVDEIQKDIDELQEDVEDIEKDVDEDEKRDVEQAKTLTDIQNDLRKLMSDIERLRVQS